MVPTRFTLWRTIMTIQLSNAARESIRDFVSISVTLNTKQTKMVDTLVADGVTHEMCFAPKGDAPREFYDSICEAVTLGFSKPAQKLLAFTRAEVKALSEAQKTERRYWQQQTGSKVKDIRNALKKRESNPTGQNATKLELAKRAPEDALKRVTELDPTKDAIPDVLDIPSATAHIKQALKYFS